MNNVYKRLDASDKIYKPLILKWLAEKFGYENYPHSYKDQWIIWDISYGEIRVSFDLRQLEHRELLSKIPIQLIGQPQFGTLKIVNKETFFLSIDCILRINYPVIINSELIGKTKHVDNEDGIFYVYDWAVKLSDSTYIFYQNQKSKMDLKESNNWYSSIIQEREFLNFLKAN